MILSVSAVLQETQPTPGQVEKLSRLNDLALPDPVAMTPQTAGWYLLGGLVLVLSTWLVIRALRRYHRNRYRREALAELDRLESRARSEAERVAALREVPALLKRTALSAWPRTDVAELAGADWLTFLDATSRGEAFANGAGQALLKVDYGSPAALKELTGRDADMLLRSAREWIRVHRA